MLFCRHPRQWTQHGGLRQSYVSYPPPLQEEDDVGDDFFEPLGAARHSSQHMCGTAVGGEQCGGFLRSSHDSSLSGSVLAFVPAAVQAGRRTSPTERAACESSPSAARKRSWLCVSDQRPSTMHPEQASYMRPTASSLAKAAQCRSKSQEFAPTGDQPQPIRIPCPPAEQVRCGLKQAHSRVHRRAARAERSPSGGSDEECHCEGSPVRDGSQVSRVVNALMDVTQLQQGLKALGNKHQSLQALAKVCECTCWDFLAALMYCTCTAETLVACVIAVPPVRSPSISCALACGQQVHGYTTLTLYWYAPKSSLTLIAGVVTGSGPGRLHSSEISYAACGRCKTFRSSCDAGTSRGD